MSFDKDKKKDKIIDKITDKIKDKISQEKAVMAFTKAKKQYYYSQNISYNIMDYQNELNDIIEIALILTPDNFKTLGSMYMKMATEIYFNNNKLFCKKCVYKAQFYISIYLYDDTGNFAKTQKYLECEKFLKNILANIGRKKNISYKHTDDVVAYLCGILEFLNRNNKKMLYYYKKIEYNLINW